MGKKEDGYVWKDGLLFHEVVDDTGQQVPRLVMLGSRRKKALRLAHENSGHVGVRGMRKLLNGRFSWPGMGKDVVDLCTVVL